MKIMKPMTTLALVTSYVAGELLRQQWKACGDGDEGGDAENVV